MIDLAPDLVVGGKLRLLRPLGQGGMGVVWAASHLTLGTEVAVKLIRPERQAESPAMVARFEREARATARIAHPHVVRVMDYGTIDGAVPYLVMELLRGFSLAELLERGGRLSFATAKLLAEQLGGALESAHGHGIVHRDVKPQNIFITEGNRDVPLFVKVLDFGVAKMVGAGFMPGGTATLTETGVVIGSVPYMSPEQLQGSKDLDERADLWSLAIILYEVLTGVTPFRGNTFVTVGAAVLSGKYAPATALRPTLPRGIDDWFAKALCLEPDGRFASAREMVEAFLVLETPPDEPDAVVPHRVSDALAETVEVGSPEMPSPTAPPEPQETALVEQTADHAPVAPRPSNGVGAEDVGARSVAQSAESGVGTAADEAAPASARSSRVRTYVVAGVGAAFVAGISIFLKLYGGASALGECPPGMVLHGRATFQMGSPAEGDTPTDETPLHEVRVGPFCLDATEVTVTAYLACERCGAPPAAVDIEGLTPNARTFWGDFCNPEGSGDHPVNCVDWSQASAYCASVGKRLPTEAEWEFAARGASRRTYPWGAAPPLAARLNACGAECSDMLTKRFEQAGKGPWPGMHAEDDKAPQTARVALYDAGKTPLGVFDMAGNVWEWTDSHYCPYGQDECGDSRRVLRGGGWDTVDSQFVRAAHRRPSAPTARGWSIGFRCAKAP